MFKIEHAYKICSLYTAFDSIIIPDGIYTKGVNQVENPKKQQDDSGFMISERSAKHCI